MANELHDVISLPRPAVVDNTGSSGRVVDFFAIHHDLSLAGSHRPNHDNLMFLSSAIRS